MTAPKNPTSGDSPENSLPVAGGSREAAAAADMAAVLVNAVAGAAAAAGGGITFDFVFNNTTYTVQVYAPDANSQYGFRITKGADTIAALTYKDEADWEIAVGLPAAFKVDDNLTINTLNVDIKHGAVQPLS